MCIDVPDHIATGTEPREGDCPHAGTLIESKAYVECLAMVRHGFTPHLPNPWRTLLNGPAC